MRSLFEDLRDLLDVAWVVERCFEKVPGLHNATNGGAPGPNVRW